jgi:hypothetical protein
MRLKLKTLPSNLLYVRSTYPLTKFLAAAIKCKKILFSFFAKMPKCQMPKRLSVFGKMQRTRTRYICWKVGHFLTLPGFSVTSLCFKKWLNGQNQCQHLSLDGSNILGSFLSSMKWKMTEMSPLFDWKEKLIRFTILNFSPYIVK